MYSKNLPSTSFFQYSVKIFKDILKNLQIVRDFFPNVGSLKLFANSLRTSLSIDSQVFFTLKMRFSNSSLILQFLFEPSFGFPKTNFSLDNAVYCLLTLSLSSSGF